jgi:hypothetical protein
MGQDNGDAAARSTARREAGRLITPEEMAKIADDVAKVAEYSAIVHDQMSSRVPGAAEHAARDRRLAAAERDVAAAYRQGSTPTPAARQQIIDSRLRIDQRVPDDQGKTDYETPPAAALRPRTNELDATQKRLDGREQHRTIRRDLRDRDSDEDDRAADHRDTHADDSDRRDR